ncbi:alpha-2-macroglobulin [Chitinophaga sp. MD30]|nr:alpha-2-macroglobulin [Chitinophaga sp. MD30]
MRLLSLLCAIVLITAIKPAMAQFNYEERWKAVLSLEEKGLPQSALEQVDKIYTQAVKDKKEVQQIKALIFRIKFTENRIENSNIQQLTEIDREIKQRTGAPKAILQSMKAEMLWIYLQDNRYRLYNVTAQPSGTSTDITAWSIDRLHREIAATYEASLKDKALLQKTDLTAYDDILVKGKDTRHLRPVLFDLLTHRALNYFASGERELLEPSNQFELTDEAAYAPAAVFAAHKFTTGNKESQQYRALLLLQELISFHLNGNRTALLDADLARMEFVQLNAVMPDKDALYEKALLKMQQDYKGEKEVTRAYFLLAQYLYGQVAERPDEDAPSAPKEQKENLGARALALCEQAIKLAPESNGGSSCAQLRWQILSQNLQLQTEFINLPDKPFRTLVSYRNTSKIYLRVAKVDETFLQQLRKTQADYRNGDAQANYWKLILSRPVLTAWEQPVPDPKDYREHNTEIKINALPLGQYMIVASIAADFPMENNPLAMQLIHTSNISYIGNQTNQYYALHRETGEPLAGVKLKVWDNATYYNQKDTRAVIYEGTTDKQGLVTPKVAKNNRYVRYEWTWGNDHLFPDESRYIYDNSYRPNKEEENKIHTFLFSDRGIYRPGQTVYFKGIVIRKDKNEKSRIVPNYKTTISLTDANGDEADSVVVTSNEYGAYSGKFKLPEGRMNGEFTIADSDETGQITFAVEEYKRPKFKVAFEPVKGTYRVGDKVSVQGNATAYAGNIINGAKVKYRVVRTVRYPYPWLFGYRSIPYGNSQEIISGEAETDSAGTFTVTFPAMPDKKVKPSDKPVFTYQVSADVTDLNGETRTGEVNVAAGYQALDISVGLGEEITRKDLQKVAIVTANLNNNFEPADIQVALLPLQHPDRLLRKRYWQQPDQFTLSQEEYVRLFPLDIYKDEDKPASWKRNAAAWQKNFRTVKDSTTDLYAAATTPGWYELQVSATDKYGEKVIQKKVFQLIDERADKLPFPAYMQVATEDKTYEPGEQVNVAFGTTAGKIHLLQQVERTEDDEEIKFLTLNSGIKRISYPVTDKDRGNFSISYTFVKDNRVFSWKKQVAVPWTNKQLKIELAAHRDKLLPGEKEKWTLNISGSKKEKVAAELMATMYDASLDAFRTANWSLPDLYRTYYGKDVWNGADNFKSISAVIWQRIQPPPVKEGDSYDALNWFGWRGRGEGVYERQIRIRGAASLGRSGGKNLAMPPPAPEARMMEKSVAASAPAMLEGKMAGVQMADNATLNESVVVGYSSGPKKKEEVPVQPRKNFNETAFFLPELHTDANGNIAFDFIVPEALTTWRFMGLGHTKELSFGYIESSITTQKPLMVQPNAPRFLREGDRMEFSAKISNLADSTLIGQARLELIDATTMKPVDGWFQNLFPVQHFTVQKGQSTAVSFPLQIPYSVEAPLLYRVVAQAGNFSDGEENTIPVLTNAMLVTETLPLPVRGDGKHTFRMDKLLNSGKSSTLRQHALTVEFTSNPAWYAVQALPYLMEYPYECSEQVFNRYYANTLAAHIVNKVPGIRTVFEKWKTTDTAALQSNLEKNQELKSLLLQETPWVLQAKDENTQKKNIALLFDLKRMDAEAGHALEQLQQKQLPSGAFPWFTGMWEDRYITQYILAGIGRLGQLKAAQVAAGDMVAKALGYLDTQIDKDYHQLKNGKADLNKQQIGNLQAHYLYLRGMFADQPVPADIKPAYDYYLGQAKKYGLNLSRYSQAMIAIALNRAGDANTAKQIIASLKENAIVSKEQGMYWKEIRGGYYWHEAPIETQAMLVEAFELVTKDEVAVADMKTWLLKNKQTNNWSTTKATADACYAVLLSGDNWLAAAPQVEIDLGGKVIKPTTGQAEAGTGYFKDRVASQEVKPAMGNVTVNIKDSKGQPAWGAIYWQYFEQLDKITPAQTPLSLQKQLFIQRNSPKGPVLTKVEEGNQLKVGDRVKVQVILKTDRDMEYVHLKDMRAAGFEPENVISASKWQNGLSYYESTKDAATNFFFSYLPKGTHVFEYTLFVTHIGDYSNGISTVQCMYAPEFSAHSEGIRVKVVE